ncbi:hypothetical protein Pd630_LPD05550 [Rhodococcus opacus PD630]|nr:hypothetical protein Pd630_LPD05550 [Rhodococcus opacus PD630]
MPTPWPRTPGRRHTGEEVTGSEIEDPHGTGFEGAVDGGDPVDGIDEAGARESAGLLLVETAAHGPLADDVDRLRECGVVEADLDREGLEDRREDGAATLLGVALTGLVGLDLLAPLLDACQLGGRAGQHDAATGVTDAEDGSTLGLEALGELLDDLTESFRVDVGDSQHRGGVGGGDHSATTADEAGSRTDELSEGEEFAVLLTRGGNGLRGEESLGVADHRHGSRNRGIEALSSQRTQRCDLGEEDAGERHRRRGERCRGGSGRLGAVLFVGEFLLEDPRDGVESDRAHDEEFLRHGGQVVGRVVDDRGECRLESVVAAQFLQRAQPGCTLTTEGERVRLTSEQTIHEGALARRPSVVPVYADAPRTLRVFSVSCGCRVVNRHAYVLSWSPLGGGGDSVCRPRHRVPAVSALISSSGLFKVDTES